MTVLVSSSRVHRRPIAGIDNYETFACNQLHGHGLVIVEPTFKEFAEANAAQLSAPLRMVHMLDPEDSPMAAVLVSYSRANARAFKGWLNDVVDAAKDRGYPNPMSLHIPFESYGVPMVGSVLGLFFGVRRLSLQLSRYVVFPADLWPEMVHHAPASRNRGGVYPGTAGLNGFLNSRTSFLPDLSLWDGEGLRAEYREGQTVKSENLRAEQLREMFGVESWQTLKDLHLTTPPAILQQIVQHLRMVSA